MIPTSLSGSPPSQRSGGQGTDDGDSSGLDGGYQADHQASWLPVLNIDVVRPIAPARPPYEYLVQFSG